MLDFANILGLCKGSASSCSVKAALLLHLHFPQLVSVVTGVGEQCLDLSVVFGYWEELRLLLSLSLPSVVLCFPRAEQHGWVLGSLRDGSLLRSGVMLSCPPPADSKEP